MKKDYLKWGALAAALVATASAEYELARAVGFNEWVAAAVPAALDLYTVRALRAHKEVLAAVAAMIGVNAASHLVTTGLLPVNVWLVVAVAAIAPLVLWRVHSLGDGHAEPSKLDAMQLAPAVEVTAQVTTEEPNLLDVIQEVPAVPELAPVVIPAASAMTSAPFMWESITPEKVTAVAAETPRQVVTEVVTLSPADLRRKATRMHRDAVTSGGRGVTIDQLRGEFGLSRREATELRRQVVTEVAS
ncbi:hypothetical protein AB0M39_25790 [Streptomyces sp. NPDC051907]|uniref:hypothetical protein n=1 Tax=Streptomyces sp. NPDC051907 TaxID=3155284 RepID=UPI00343F7659